MSNNVQAMTIAMFGAAAGGYTAELAASVEANGVAAVANSIMNLQQPLLGLDLSDDADWTDFVLANLGINDTNAAYGTAAAYFADRLADGATRGDVIAEAVAYLLGGNESAEFADIASAFVALVTDAQEWSVGDGAEVIAFADLRSADGIIGNPATGTVFNLTAALATLNAANTAVDDLVDAWGEANDDATPTAGEIQAAAATAEAAVETALGDAGFNGAVTVTFDDLTETYGTEEDEAEDADLASAKVQLNAEKVSLEADLTVAEAALGADGVEAVDAYLAAVTAAEDAQDAEDAALVTSDAEAAKLAISAGLTDWYSYSGGDTDEDGYVALVNVYDVTDLVLFVNADGDVRWYDYGDVGSGEASTDPADAYTETPDAVDGLDLTAVIAAAQAYQAAYAASEDADTAESDALDDVAAVDASFVVMGALAAEAADYETAMVAIDDFNTAMEALDEAVAALDAVRADAAALLAADEAVTDAQDAIADAGYDLEAAGYGALVAGADDDESEVYTFDGGTISIADGDFNGGDVIAVAGFTYNDGAAADDGDNSVLEFFVEEDGSDLVVTFEEVEFGSNAATPEVVTITLVGMSLEDVVIGGSYITVA